MINISIVFSTGRVLKNQWPDMEYFFLHFHMLGDLHSHCEKNVFEKEVLSCYKCVWICGGGTCVHWR